MSLIPILFANIPGGAASPPLTGQIIKTLAPSGGDFSTLADLFDWTDQTPITGYLDVNVQPGTYSIPSGDAYSLGSTNLAYIRFTGTNKSTCIFEHDLGEDEWFLEASFSELILFNLTVRPVSARSAKCKPFLLHHAALTIANCIFPNCELVASLKSKSYVRLDTVAITAQAGGHYDSFFWVEQGSRLEIAGDVVMDGHTAGDGYGIWCPSGTVIFSGTGNELKNCGLGLSVDYEGTDGKIIIKPGSLTLSDNTADYDVTVNEVQYDGRYISNGAAALSFKS